MSDEMPRGRTPSVEEEDVIRAIKQIEDDCFGSQEVAEHLPIGRERTREKLNELVDDGVLKSKKIGSANVYRFNGV